MIRYCVILSIYIICILVSPSCLSLDKRGRFYIVNVICTSVHLLLRVCCVFPYQHRGYAEPRSHGVIASMPCIANRSIYQCIPATHLFPCSSFYILGQLLSFWCANAGYTFLMCYVCFWFCCFWCAVSLLYVQYCLGVTVFQFFWFMY